MRLSFTEEEVKRAAALKLWLEERLKELAEDQERLKEALFVVDAVLRTSSFAKASDLSAQPSAPAAKLGVTVTPEFTEVRPIRRSKDDSILANAFITPKSATIVPASEVKLGASTPPFKSFYLERILGGMRAKDAELLRQGRLASDEIINYVVEEEGGYIKRIMINNYRDSQRLNEIMKSASWVFTRMLEKAR